MRTATEKMTGFVKVMDFEDFEREFDEYGRDDFSEEGLKILFEYYEELSDSIGEPIEFDCIAICLDWAEYDAEELFTGFAPCHEMQVEEGQVTFDNAREIWKAATEEEQEDLLESLIGKMRDETEVLEGEDCFLVMAY